LLRRKGLYAAFAEEQAMASELELLAGADGVDREVPLSTPTVAGPG
jgi:hypothetical protein